jgi:hypothetical protein
MTELTPRPKAQREDLITDTLPPALRRADPVTELPLLMLYPHSRCNCRCVMCDIWRASGKEELIPRLRSGCPSGAGSGSNESS